MDGVIETNTAVMLAPYVNNPATRGVPNYPAPELDRIVRMFDARGWQIFVHAIGDGGVRMTLDAFERAAKANPPPARGRRHRVEHIETIDLADVPRFGALGVIASMQPPHTRLMNSPNPRGQWAGNIGPERQARGWMWKDIREWGGRLAFGSDWPVASLNPLTGIWIGLNRIGHGSVASQRLSLDEMIDGYTAGAAYAAFDEDRRAGLLQASWLTSSCSLEISSRNLPGPPTMSRRQSRSSTAASCIADSTLHGVDRAAGYRPITSISRKRHMTLPAVSSRPGYKHSCGPDDPDRQEAR